MRLAELGNKPVRSSDEHAEIAVLRAKVSDANRVNPGVPIENQAEREIREDRENKEAAERAEVCARIASMNQNGWHGLREVLRQHGFGSLFNMGYRRGRDVADLSVRRGSMDPFQTNRTTNQEQNRTTNQI